MQQELAELLNNKVAFFNHPRFIEHDPISIPHLFSRKQDIEIMGFWVAMLAWGQRKTILQKGKELIDLMDGAPYDFVMNHQTIDLQRFESFKHRTFNSTDTLYFLSFFQRHYQQHSSLEMAFTQGEFNSKNESIEQALNGFCSYFFDSEWAPQRTKKHVSAPIKNSACKRLCMFLRWMVRKDTAGVDFGIWSKISPKQLICPLDVHSQRTAEKLGLVKAGPTTWKKALELTHILKQIDATDPVKYDFALYGMGIEDKTQWK
ncbi:TIGR02757 family protein [Aquirufa ecclesiirivi]|uniref:TIGR02757 family protein n=1 Tax=Aquirufa ecclesiirivi TaxID=2715124 RepID=UPI0022A856C9|nr:TIGR02757 family protein [Aquirufa ecclesiirivi]MCZ2472932.1 TIGR02757 family protein [Aquirufa ecclesiirivi]MDF0694608.1 TIGR02757 family protein [Aquirufa ecclesiirivi]